MPLPLQMCISVLVIFKQERIRVGGAVLIISCGLLDHILVHTHRQKQTKKKKTFYTFFIRHISFLSLTAS